MGWVSRAQGCVTAGSQHCRAQRTLCPTNTTCSNPIFCVHNYSLDTGGYKRRGGVWVGQKSGGWVQSWVGGSCPKYPHPSYKRCLILNMGLPCTTTSLPLCISVRDLEKKARALLDMVFLTTPQNTHTHTHTHTHKARSWCGTMTRGRTYIRCVKPEQHTYQ